MAISGDHVVVILDDASGSPRTFANGDIISIDLGLMADQHDVTGFGDAVHKYINGQKRAPVTIKGYLTTTATIGTHTVIQPVFKDGKQVTLEVRVGQNAAPTTGDPKYTGEFFVASYSPVFETGGAVKFTAMLTPATGAEPLWGNV